MSEAQDTQKVVDIEEKKAENSRPKEEVDEERHDLENKRHETPVQDNSSAPKHSSDPHKILNRADSSSKVPLTGTKNHDSPQQQKPGECNLLPVLIERLRSALELSCSTQNSHKELPPEDSGIDSEEDLRIWASGLQSSEQNSPETRLKSDIQILEELLFSDIQAALAHLQETLQRVDVNAQSKVNSTLDSANKLTLLRLVSNLLARLKVSEETQKTEGSNCQTPSPKRKRNERHTIGVSTEELERARKWMEQNKSSSPDIFDGTTTISKPVEKHFEKVQDKHLKDVINHQQSLQSKVREPDRQFHEPPNNSPEQNKRFEEDLPVPTENCAVKKCNKFAAKKTKIKRANTIDIPSFLKYRDESLRQRQKGGFALRRPIDISDKVFSNGTTVIPSFQPKTENDRKFMAMINRNNDSGPQVPAVPFKSFSYRNNSSAADKNWNSRFSNIKTAFDKPQTAEANQEGMVIGSLKLPYNLGKQKQSCYGFRHAPTSPFQKIDRPENPVKYGYSPKSGNSMLQAKMRIFDKENGDLTDTPVPPPRFKVSKYHQPEATKPSFTFPKVIFPVSNTICKEKKFNELMKAELGDHRDQLYQKPKRNSIANCYEVKNKYPDLQKQYSVHPSNISEECSLRNVGSRSKKSLNNSRRSYSNDTDYIRRFEDPPQRTVFPVNRFYESAYQEPQRKMQSVAVQTGNESFAKHEEKTKDRRSRNHPKTPSNNVYVQTEENQSYTPFSDTSNEDTPSFKSFGYQPQKFDHRPCSFSPVRPVPNFPISVNQASKVPYQEFIYPGRDHYLNPYYEAETPSYVPPEYSVEVIPRDQNVPYYSRLMNMQKTIQNQDINPDGIVTRYTSAVGTFENPNNQSFSDIQRHNMLQQNLIKRFQNEPSRNASPKNYFNEMDEAPVIDCNNTQHKINMFEEKNRHFRPLDVPVAQKEKRSPIQISVSPVDTSDEYLMSCASNPSRSIVLSKSESWHQLAMAKNTLQVPGPASKSFSKPPKPKSPFRLSKQFEAPSSSDSVKKMEETVQKYFQRTPEIKTKRRSFTSKKNGNPLARSHTAPHICEEKIFDENADVDKAFDSIFQETTRSDVLF